jgi:drug/metabolite transporter (DMT)-like permease
MINLFLSILSSVLLAVSFKILDNLKINSFQAIVANYYVASLTGYLTASSFIHPLQLSSQKWFPLACALGFVFIFILNIIAVTTQKLGITVAGVANKMSIVIPVSVAVWLYNDKINFLKATGLLMALVAVFFTAKKSTTQAPEQKKDKRLYLLPLLIFFGSGLIDSSINYAQRYYLSEDIFPLFLSVIFATAGIIGTITLVYNKFIKNEYLSLKAIASGVLIGFINFFTMYFVIKCLNDKLFEPSVFFPINNMGILALSTLAAYVLFKEKLSPLNWMGIALALISIFTITFS